MPQKLFALLGCTLLLAGCEVLFVANTLVGCAMRPEMDILPRELPAARAGEPYWVRIEVVDTSSPLTGIHVSPRQPLPAGLTLEHAERAAHGVIAGTPLTPGVYPLRVYAGSYGTQCVGKKAERSYRLEVLAAH
ncbi:hypothetical protein F3I62_11145 [Pseudomonas sp. R-28-1W-6]|uniref:Ig domain-containing protein n=1 Tax=Pseudomonas sp. R-28-1W-6 TaxID=2650101 RepID=UPI0013660889|nr:Ig domain-containing protein [Pseudomonas sp. R-28-1W-6]MWV12648.1 hypothetical protein [Pseudomonas sp. R-28-1W-6]